MKLLKYFFVLLLSVILILAATAFAITQFYGDEIKAKVIEAINKEVLTEVEVKGPAEIAVFKHFPKISVVINGIEVKESTPGSDKTLLKAQKIYLLTNLLDLIRQNWKIEALVIEDGMLNMRRDKNGLINYKIMEKQQDTTATAPPSFLINIEKAELNNVVFSFIDESAEVSLDLDLHKANLSGNFAPDKLALHTKASIFSKSIRIKEIDYGASKNLDFDGYLKISPKKNTYSLNIDRFSIEENDFGVHGEIAIVEKHPNFDLHITADNVSIKSVPYILPVSFSEKIKDFKGSGNLQLNASINGLLSKQQDPVVTATFNVTKGKLKYGNVKQTLEQLSFNGTFTNGQQHGLSSSHVSIKDLQAKIKGEAFDADVDFVNLKYPTVTVKANGRLDLGLLNPLLAKSLVQKLEGYLILDNLSYRGKVRDLKDPSSGRLSGGINFEQAQFSIDTSKVLIPNGKLTMSYGTVKADAIHIKASGTELAFSGEISNLPFLSSDKSDPLNLNLTVKANSINISNILAMLEAANYSTTEKSKKSPQLNATGKIKVNALFAQLDKFKAYDVRGTVSMKPGHLDLDGFSFNALNGMIDYDGQIDVNEDILRTRSIVSLNEVDISDLFYQTNNFNQEAITDKNLGGKLTADLDVTAVFDEGKLIKNRLATQADITIKEGQLVNFKPLENLSRFVDLEELMDVRFSTLQNQIHIAEGNILIPEMVIRSNALNVSVSGMQTLDNVIDYQIKINLFDVLARKIKKRKRPSEYEVAGEDNFNFFLTMTGTLSNPVVKYDKRGMKERMAKQKEEFRKAPIQEDYTRKDEIKDWEIKEDLEYIDWDE